MKKLVLLYCFFIISIFASAQINHNYIKGVKKISMDMIDSIHRIRGELTESDVIYLQEQYKQAVSIWTRAFDDGDLIDKTATLYYSTLAHFNLGFLFSERQRYAEAYGYYQSVANSLEFLKQPGRFPVDYYLEDSLYILNIRSISGIQPVYYSDMGAVCAKLTKWDEAEKYSRLALVTDSASFRNQFRATATLVTCLKNKRQENQEMLDLLLSYWKLYRSLDRSDQQKMDFNENEIFNAAKNLADKLSATGDQGLSNAMLAQALYELEKYKESEHYYLLASQKVTDIYVHPRYNTAFFYIAMKAALDFRNKELVAWSAHILLQHSLLKDMHLKDVERAFKFLGDKNGAKKVRRMLKKQHKL